MRPFLLELVEQFPTGSGESVWLTLSNCYFKNATRRAFAPAGVVATTVSVLVSMTETVPSPLFAT